MTNREPMSPTEGMVRTAEGAMVTALARRFGSVALIRRDPMVVCIGDSRGNHVHITLEGRTVPPDPPPGAEPIDLDPPGQLGLT